MPLLIWTMISCVVPTSLDTKSCRNIVERTFLQEDFLAKDTKVEDIYLQDIIHEDENTRTFLEGHHPKDICVSVLFRLRKPFLSSFMLQSLTLVFCLSLLIRSL
jgi:hypothetical protein